jgi:hypothetical protein
VHANLFTASFQAKLLAWRRLRQWSLVWLALLLLGGAWGLAQVPSIMTARRTLQDALAASEPTRLVLDEIAALEAALAAEDQQLVALRPFGPDARPVSVLAALVDATRAAEGRIVLRSVQYSNPTPYVAPAANGSPAVPGVAAKPVESSAMTIIIEGVSLDDESVDRFVHDLVETGEVSHVELKSCVREAGGPAPSSSTAGAMPPIERLRFEIHGRL